MNECFATGVQSGRLSSGLQKVLRQLPLGGFEREAIEAGEIDAVIDYGSANVIVFPAARRALLDIAKRATSAERKAALEMPERNSVLAALPYPEYRRLVPALEPVVLEFGDVLHEVGAPIRYVYFPVDCVVGLLTEFDSQRTVATGLVGHEGMVGIPLALDDGVSSVRAVVQVAGTALRMLAARFTNEFQRSLQLQRYLYRYAQAELNLARQIAACVASHLFEQRLAGWLLMVDDRSGPQKMFLTHEHLASVLNVRRVSVTLACGVLSARGFIRCNRGNVSILDRKGLERAAGHCYRPIKICTM